ncbi:MAG TPA: hypothetical protein VJ376_16750, partial [Pseudomonadota bacterium]|nr:hypothetical protein [Pseudomonadota bacterium]
RWPHTLPAHLRVIIRTSEHLHVFPRPRFNVRMFGSLWLIPRLRRFTVSDLLTPPCGKDYSSQDASRFEQIGLHIWSTI